MTLSDTQKQRQFRHYVKWFVAISATVSLVIAASQGRIAPFDVALYVAFIYILTSFNHPIVSNARV